MSLINLITPTTQSVLQNGTVPLTNIARRKGCTLDANSDTIILKRPGYYTVDISATVTSATAGVTSTLVVTKAGVPVQGLTASESIADANEIVNLHLTGIVRVFCSEGASTLNLVNTGDAITLTNLSVVVEDI